jgi:uncharacterized protein (TIGR02145 family)
MIGFIGGGRVLLAAVAVLVGLMGCGDNTIGGGGTGSIVYGDPLTYGDQTYTTVKIGGKTWMAQNLNYRTDSSWCYRDADSNCLKYGKLYTWAAAKTVCPKGWHLPDTSEWRKLVAVAGGQSTAGNKLKSMIGWDSDGNGTDSYGFSAMPGGNRYPGGDFGSAGSNGYWWTATERGSGGAYYQRMYCDNDNVGGYYGNDNKNYGDSVRCVAD